VISVLVLSLDGNVLAKGPAEIIHDAEYYVLEAQHGKKWAAEDKELDKKLAKLLKNIENARPETIAASKPRIAPSKKIPFDPREAIMQVPEWNNLDQGWGVGN
jgi:hypothetical protein